MKFILNTWKIVNVKTPWKGKFVTTRPIFQYIIMLEFLNDYEKKNMKNLFENCTRTWKLFFTCIVGYHKRDDFSRPILSADDSKLDFLRKECKEWRSSKREGLSQQTFTAVIQSFSALIDLSTYLLERHAFSYVLLGKFQSDPLEGRFGYYRQLSGGNFFISCRQLLQAEKKIRLLNVMQVM